MRTIEEYINESLKFNYDSKKKSRYKADILKEKMPSEITAVIKDLANEILPDIKDISMDDLEEEIYKYFALGFDEFWNVYFDFTTEKERDYELTHNIGQDEKLKAIWDAWGDDIMQVFLDVINK